MSDVLGSPLTSGTLAPHGSGLVLAEWEAAGTEPGTQPQYQAPLHRHHDDDEAWYVLAGRLKVLIGNDDYDVPAEAARRHRDILGTAMDAAGFINYPAEWWHWSYGDRYCAFQTACELALYGPR